MHELHFLSSNTYCRQVFGCKVYKLALSAATACPNRDGTAGFGGCRFCSAGGSGEFAAEAGKPLAEQLEEAKRDLIAPLWSGNKKEVLNRLNRTLREHGIFVGQ